MHNNPDLPVFLRGWMVLRLTPRLASLRPKWNPNRRATILQVPSNTFVLPWASFISLNFPPPSCSLAIHSRWSAATSLSANHPSADLRAIQSPLGDLPHLVTSHPSSI